MRGALRNSGVVLSDPMSMLKIDNLGVSLSLSPKYKSHLLDYQGAILHLLCRMTGLTQAKNSINLSSRVFTLN
jgi:hypothetical protein